MVSGIVVEQHDVNRASDPALADDTRIDELDDRLVVRIDGVRVGCDPLHKFHGTRQHRPLRKIRAGVREPDLIVDRIVERGAPVFQAGQIVAHQVESARHVLAKYAEPVERGLAFSSCRARIVVGERIEREPDIDVSLSCVFRLVGGGQRLGSVLVDLKRRGVREVGDDLAAHSARKVRGVPRVAASPQAIADKRFLAPHVDHQHALGVVAAAGELGSDKPPVVVVGGLFSPREVGTHLEPRFGVHSGVDVLRSVCHDVVEVGVGFARHGLRRADVHRERSEQKSQTLAASDDFIDFC